MVRSIRGFSVGIAATSAALVLEYAALDPQPVIRVTADLWVGPVLGDRDRLEQIVCNLSNALKFTPAGGRIDIRLERHGDCACIVVADTGPGGTFVVELPLVRTSARPRPFTCPDDRPRRASDAVARTDDASAAGRHP